MRGYFKGFDNVEFITSASLLDFSVFNDTVLTTVQGGVS